MFKHSCCTNKHAAWCSGELFGLRRRVFFSACKAIQQPIRFLRRLHCFYLLTFMYLLMLIIQFDRRVDSFIIRAERSWIIVTILELLCLQAAWRLFCFHLTVAPCSGRRADDRRYWRHYAVSNNYGSAVDCQNAEKDFLRTVSLFLVCVASAPRSAYDRG